MTKSQTDFLPEELTRLLFNKLAKTYGLVTEEWRARRRSLLEALIVYEHDPKIVDEMCVKYKNVLKEVTE